MGVVAQESMNAMQKSVDRSTQLEKDLQASKAEGQAAAAALKAAEKEMAALKKRLEEAIASEKKNVATAQKAQVGVPEV
jgi:peptidoglycan hydrolase CwlO-like protein